MRVQAREALKLASPSQAREALKLASPSQARDAWWNGLLLTPFRDRGRDPALGFDCWGLHAHIMLRERNIVVPDRPELSSRAFGQVHEAALEGLSTGPWKAIERGSERPLDLAILWRSYRDHRGDLHLGPIHCGTVTRRGFLIHCDERTDTVEVPYLPRPHRTLKTSRIDFWRWTGESA